MVGKMKTTPIRLAFLVVASMAALAVAAVLATWWLFDAQWAREQLEIRIGDALGMDVKTGPQPRFGLIRGASVTLADLEVSKQGQVVATAENARVRVALFSLLTGEVRPLELHLQRPVISIERLSPGVFNVYPSETKSETLHYPRLQRLRVSDARLSYLDRASGQEWIFEQCDLDLSNIRHGLLDSARAPLAANGELQCMRLSQERFAISGLSVEIRGDHGVFDLDVVSGSALQGQISAQLEVDLSASPPEFRLTGRLAQFEVGAFMAVLGPTQATTGMMDLDLILAAHGATWQEVRSSAAGTLSMAGGDLEIVGYDLDDELDGYATTQRFNLIDVGAVLLAGPFGLVASRGYAFTGLLEGSGGSTRIVQMVSKWTVEGGVAQARDVAFRTQENRLALAGGLDFAQYRFRDLQVAVVDRDGCAIVEQVITGPFHEPEVKRPNFLVSAVGPLLDLVKRGIKAISDKDCEAFYTGSIQHP
jgi:hypothetical protein